MKDTEGLCVGSAYLNPMCIKLSSKFPFSAPFTGVLRVSPDVQIRTAIGANAQS